MKKSIYCFFVLAAVLTACNNEGDKKAAPPGNGIKMPYEATYTTRFTQDIPDSMLLLVLNSYKYWESGDMKALRSTMGDSMTVDGADGFKFRGLTDSLMKIWQTFRDSLSSVKINMAVWLKNHSVKDSADYISTWYEEIDTYKSGRVDTSNYSDINGIKNGKINWYSQFKQKTKQ